jgi:hypothetical protein
MKSKTIALLICAAGLTQVAGYCDNGLDNAPNDLETFRHECVDGPQGYPIDCPTEPQAFAPAKPMLADSEGGASR